MSILTLAEWAQLRTEVHRAAQTSLAIPGLRLETVDAQVLRAAAVWAGTSVRRVNWDWRSLVAGRTHPIRTSIWHNDQLCGLMCGNTSSKAVMMRYLEGAPNPSHPLRGRVAQIGLATIEVYAFALGIPVVILDQPHRALISVYGARGYGWMTEQGFAGYFGRRVIP